MTKIESTFNDVKVCHGDIWVADYTEKTKTLPKEDCKYVNICENANKAYIQLVDTWRFLDGKGFYDRKHCKVYLNISVPEHEYDLTPFSSFTANQDEHLKFRRKYKLHLLGINSVLAVNSGILLAVRPNI